jgi:lipocalin
MRFIWIRISLLTVLLFMAGSSDCLADAVASGAPSGGTSQGGRLVDSGDVGSEKLLGGKWMEIARTDVPSERGCSRVTMEFVKGLSGGVALFVQGWDNDAGVWRRIDEGAEKTVRPPWWLFWERPVRVQAEALRCLKGSDADGWIAIVGSDGVRVLSRDGGMPWNAWNRCYEALQSAGQPVGGLIYFLTQ